MVSRNLAQAYLDKVTKENSLNPNKKNPVKVSDIRRRRIKQRRRRAGRRRAVLYTSVDRTPTGYHPFKKTRIVEPRRKREFSHKCDRCGLIRPERQMKSKRIKEQPHWLLPESGLFELVWVCRDFMAHSRPDYYDLKEALEEKEAFKILNDDMFKDIRRNWKEYIENFQKRPEYKKIKDDLESEEQFNVIKLHINFDNYLKNLLLLFTYEILTNKKLSRKSNESLINETLGKNYIDSKIIDNEKSFAHYILIMAPTATGFGFVLGWWYFNNETDVTGWIWLAIVSCIFIANNIFIKKQKFETLLQQSSDLFDAITNTLRRHLLREVVTTRYKEKNKSLLK